MQSTAEFVFAWVRSSESPPSSAQSPETGAYLPTQPNMTRQRKRRVGALGTLIHVQSNKHWESLKIQHTLYTFITHLVQHNHLHLAHFGHSFFDEIQNPSRSGNNNMHCREKEDSVAEQNGLDSGRGMWQGGKGRWAQTCLIKPHDVVTKICTTCGSHDLNPAHVFADLYTDLAHLQSQFSGGHNDQCCKHIQGRQNGHSKSTHEFRYLHEQSGCIKKICMKNLHLKNWSK